MTFTYDNLDDAIGKMHRAAIDCHMADQQFYPNWGNDMIYAKWGFMLNFYNRPDANGKGGGTGNGVNHSVADVFDAIRADIDGIIEPWKTLPDGSSAATPATTTNAAASKLGAKSAEAGISDGDEIQHSYDTASELVLNKLEGAYRAPFHDKYFIQFTTVRKRLAEACMVLNLNYTTQSEMWKPAQEDVAAICAAAHDLWKSKAERAAKESAEVTLSVVGAVVAVTAAAATAGAGGVALAALSASAKSMVDVMKSLSKVTNVEGSTYGDIRNSLQSSLDDLDKTLGKQEKALSKMMLDSAETMRSKSADFNLDAFALGSYPIPESTITVDPTDTTIVSNNMTRIEQALQEARSSLGSAPASNPTPRGSGIGYTSSGSHTAATELHTLTARYLELTAAEYERGHGLFDATVEDFFQTEAEIQEMLHKLLADEALTEDPGV